MTILCRGRSASSGAEPAPIQAKHARPVPQSVNKLFAWCQ